MNGRQRTSNFIAFDLEMNQPSDKIIQIGAVAGNIDTGEILETMSNIVKIDEPLCTDSSICDIPKLTGITDAMIEIEGIHLPDAYLNLAALRKKHNCHRNPIVWGGGDMSHLKSELINRFGMQFSGGFGQNRDLPMFCFGMRWFDVKSFFQMKMHMKGQSMQSGLRKAISRMGLEFHGKGHDAMYDAYNTFKIAHKLFGELAINGDNNGK